jgi:hypothetical protein
MLCLADMIGGIYKILKVLDLQVTFQNFISDLAAWVHPAAYVQKIQEKVLELVAKCTTAVTQKCMATI